MIKLHESTIKSFYLLVVLCILNGCSLNYSLNGISIPPDAKTVSVDYFPNNAPLVQPTLSQSLTEALKDRFVAETNLGVINELGDLHFEGSITNYVINPVAIQGNETAALNRLTVTVYVKFTNKIDNKFNYETSFSAYEDYDSSQDLSSIEEELIGLINVQLVEDIFNKAVINW